MLRCVQHDSCAAGVAHCSILPDPVVRIHLLHNYHRSFDRHGTAQGARLCVVRIRDLRRSSSFDLDPILLPMDMALEAGADLVEHSPDCHTVDRRMNSVAHIGVVHWTGCGE